MHGGQLDDDMVIVQMLALVAALGYRSQQALMDVGVAAVLHENSM